MNDKWEVRHGFVRFGTLGFVSSVDTYPTQEEAKARARELYDKGIIPAGERIEIQYVGDDESISKSTMVTVRLARDAITTGEVRNGT